MLDLVLPIRYNDTEVTTPPVSIFTVLRILYSVRQLWGSPENCFGLYVPIEAVVISRAVQVSCPVRTSRHLHTSEVHLAGVRCSIFPPPKCSRFHVPHHTPKPRPFSRLTLDDLHYSGSQPHWPHLYFSLASHSPCNGSHLFPLPSLLLCYWPARCPLIG